MEAGATEVPRTEAPPRPAPAGGLDSYFKLTERGTTVGREIRAGLATFMVMAYIIFVNANILSATGLDPAAVAAGTALVAGVLSIAMGLVANYPIALAAGLGINGAVAFGLVLNPATGLSPAGAMGVILLEGLVVLLLVLVGLREAVMNAVPLGLKRAIGVGIGLFILFIGLVDAGLIINNPDAAGPVPVAFVFPNTPALGVFLFGLLITIVLFVRRVPGALVISIIVTAVLAFLLGVTQAPETFTIAPNFSTLGQFNVTEVFTTLGVVAAILTIFAFMLTDFFDTMGTATGIVEQAGLTDPDGRVPGIGRLLLVDSIGAAAGGAAGVSSNTSYIESAAGVAEGGRTGLTAVVVGVLFLIAILVTPLAPLIPFVATGPVLVLVGYLMATLIKDIDFTNVEEGLPALLTLILMPLTFSITTGIGAGFIAWVLIKVAVGKIGDIHPLMWIVAIAFVVYFAQGLLPGGIFA
ncbi:MAG TPA: NCS2 family permease [Candidatus Limnocylindria bacterium]|nr:NCS2 family permease [Candidatus Limnocylindria bacterium]